MGMTTHRIATAIANHLKKNGLQADIEHSRRSNSKYIYAQIPEDDVWDHSDEMESQKLSPFKMKTVRISDHINPAHKMMRQSGSNDKAIETDYELRTDMHDPSEWKNIAHSVVSDFEPEMSFLKNKQSLIAKQDGGPITAYHGSPHYIGEEGFQDRAIGTGEGAQAYGHGHYFAEAEPAALDYRNKLSKAHNVVTWHNKRGEPVSVPNEIASHVNDFMKTWGSDLRDADFKRVAEKYRMTADRAENVELPDWEKSKHLIDEDFAQETIDALKSKIIKSRQTADFLENHRPRPAGHMYEVAINAHPDHFLDWDKPLSEQHPNIHTNLWNSRKEIPALWDRVKDYIQSEKTGGDLYQHVAAGHPRGQAGASDFFQRAGIRGIKYLDAGSRGAGEGSRNYVVFDPKHVEIKRRYAEGGAVDGGEVDTSYLGNLWRGLQSIPEKAKGENVKDPLQELYDLSENFGGKESVSPLIFADVDPRMAAAPKSQDQFLKTMQINREPRHELPAFEGRKGPVPKIDEPILSYEELKDRMRDYAETLSTPQENIDYLKKKAIDAMRGVSDFVAPSAYNYGGVAHNQKPLYNPEIVKHVLGKISAPPPALDQIITVAKRGRPL
jgi:hypothetical protein